MALSLSKGHNNPFHNKHFRASRLRAVDSSWNHVSGSRIGFLKSLMCFVWAIAQVDCRHPALVEALEFAELEAGAHVDDGQEEGSVQDTLNEDPYSGCPASCPKDAVTLLFAGRTGAGPTQPTKPGVPVRP